MERREQDKRISAQAERAFREFLECRQGGDRADFDRFCAERPQISAELHSLYQTHLGQTPRVERSGGDAPLRLRFRDVFGDGVEPSITLEPEPAAPASVEEAAPEEQLRRLAAHSPEKPRYRLKSEIASGGMGSVFKVWDEDLRRNLAMKVILGKSEAAARGELPAVDPKTLERFLVEAQVTAQLDHPGIVPVHELGLDDQGRVFFTMRLVRGENLARVFRKARVGDDGWTQTRVLGTLLRVCEAMAYAHAKGVIHRDLKPENIMVGRFGETYVMDWGLARILGREDVRDLRIRRRPRDPPHGDAGALPDSPLVTVDGEVVGTPAYMAPEQAEGRLDEIGTHTDVYSMGAMLYHLLSGRMPYETSEHRPSPITVLDRLCQGPPVPLSAVPEHVPVELAAICDKAMEHDIGRRYRTMEELAIDLRAFLEGRVVLAHKSGALVELRKWMIRNRSAAGLLLVILLLTIAFVVRLHQKTEVAYANEKRAVLSEGVAVEESRRANEHAVRADQSRRQAEEARDRLLRLSDRKLLDELLVEMDGLWPARPERIDALEVWLERAGALLRRQGLHRQTLLEIRGFGIPVEGVGPQRYRFEDTAARWWHDTLAELVSAVDRFSGDDPHGRTVASVEARLEFARGVERRSLVEAAAAWSAALDSIRDPAICPAYAGLELSPQLGLVPLGRNQQSGLWEFWHLASGDRPVPRESGGFGLEQGSGLVLVLIPGGSFWMGAQDEDPLAEQFCSDAQDEESPPHVVELAPFLLSKFEMTQDQWHHLTGSLPSSYRPGLRFAGREVGWLHPVESVSWEDCAQVVARADLALPSEAQWEYACRAGSSSSWWTGDDPLELDRAGNLADSFLQENGGPTGWSYEEYLDDGFVVHGPVGSFRPNPFGLHDTIGNVWEWCLDDLGAYSFEVREGDGLRQVEDAGHKTFRGGAFSITAAHARSSNRSGYAPDYRFNSLGVRPARLLEE